MGGSTSNVNKELMRETVSIYFADNDTGTKNTVFDINIPDGHAMVLYDVDFIINAGAGQVGNRGRLYLLDDVDEDVDPGHAAQKVIQSTEKKVEFTTEGRHEMFNSITLDCHRTMLVVNPNFMATQDADAGADIYYYARIWFDFVKVSPKQILDLLRQQQY